jgi:hypothetical protein
MAPEEKKIPRLLRIEDKKDNRGQKYYKQTQNWGKNLLPRWQ